METAQYITENGGAGGIIVIAGIIVVWQILKATRAGTLSENAQRRNIQRSKKDWPSK